MATKHAGLTVTPEQILAGQLCQCPACQGEGPHEPDCVVHDEPAGECTCGRTEQSKGTG